MAFTRDSDNTFETNGNKKTFSDNEMVKMFLSDECKGKSFISQDILRPIIVRNAGPVQRSAKMIFSYNKFRLLLLNLTHFS